MVSRFEYDALTLKMLPSLLTNPQLNPKSGFSYLRIFDPPPPPEKCAKLKKL